MARTPASEEASCAASRSISGEGRSGPVSARLSSMLSLSCTALTRGESEAVTRPFPSADRGAVAERCAAASATMETASGSSAAHGCGGSARSAAGAACSLGMGSVDSAASSRTAVALMGGLGGAMVSSSAGLTVGRSEREPLRMRMSRCSASLMRVSAPSTTASALKSWPGLRSQMASMAVRLAMRIGIASSSSGGATPSP